ncbi:flagellar biosynthesis anti-sigma factor FlgM [Atlantibacter hermannii]|uniref:flagellar biosynthesis anti-sigma factor FlgM n=1 Tax=Atlantibacter hermannii TaxID=565 RepID=UPI000EEC7F14|nr:flagellar biosynthesis anti-sigma factor FlgM [Atlantibacter hermannii]MDU1952506.1 flagellar biosynthesis anti-sigma factor FlgM [Atlantibacter hermannii]HAI48415.1 flagellar biosynthesis anti-sigma factor FlgM [Enterobacteriaceae bacterium]
MKINAMPQHTPMTPLAAAGRKNRQGSVAGESSTAAVETVDVTQSSLSAAVEALSGDAQEIDHDKVARMQALIAEGNYAVDHDELSGAMLDYYRNK